MSDLIDYTGKTLGDLMLDLARDVGLAVYVSGGVAVAARLPTQAARLDLLKRSVNDGYANFINGIDPGNSGARPYTRWSFLERVVTITFDPDGTGPQNIERDAGRYRLPDGITSRPKTTGWSLDSSGTHPGLRIPDTSADRVVRRWWALGTEQTGTPQIAACRPLPNPDGQQGGAAWEVIVAPKPDSGSMSMQAPFRVQPRAMQDVTERHICGSQHDQTIRLYALVEYWRNDAENAGRYDRAVEMASAAMKSSIAMDTELHPRHLTRVHDPSVGAVPITRGLVVANQYSTATYTPGVYASQE